MSSPTVPVAVEVRVADGPSHVVATCDVTSPRSARREIAETLRELAYAYEEAAGGVAGEPTPG